MKCCDKELGQGVPYVLIRYWCTQCNTEHLVDATELTEYVNRVHDTVRQEAVNGARLPDIL